jgi:hypothetical protein
VSLDRAAQLFAMILFLLVCSVAQPQTVPVPSSSQRPASNSFAVPKNGDDQKPTPAKPNASKSGRKLFGIVPDYTTVEAGDHPPPLTARQKFKLGLQYFSLYTVVFVGAEAGVDQATNNEKQYGQGAQGYGKRYGADFADGLTNSIFVTGAFPSLLRQDPRYYRMAAGTTFHRVVYAASRVLVTRQDSGRKVFNFSELLGNFTSGAISTAYYPESERSFSGVSEHAGVELGFDAGFNVLKEFAPDLEHRFLKKKTSKAASPPN